MLFFWVYKMNFWGNKVDSEVLKNVLAFVLGASHTDMFTL